MYGDATTLNSFACGCFHVTTAALGGGDRDAGSAETGTFTVWPFTENFANPFRK